MKKIPTNIYAKILLLWILALFMQQAEAAPTGDSIAAPPLPMDVRGKAGVVIRDLATGKNIVERNANDEMRPASIVKCITSAANLLAGNEHRRFVTRAYTTGKIKNGALSGNLVIEASGDPTTDSRYFPENSLMADSIAIALRGMGIDTVRGRIIFDQGAVPDDGPSVHWMTEDYKYDYGAGHYAINFRDNSLAGGRAMEDPPGYFYDALYQALANRGIAVEEGDYDAGGSRRELFERRSPEVVEIMRSMMERSDNMFAEAMLRYLSPGNTVLNAVAHEKRLLRKAGLPEVSQMVINDGSGLSRNNRVTPSFMAHLLEKMAEGKHADVYVSLFPKAGEEGTVKRFLKDTRLAGKLVLKSGSMRGVQCYAGYKLDDSGRPTHAVVIMVNEFTSPRTEVVAKAEDLLLDTFKDPADSQTTESL